MELILPDCRVVKGGKCPTDCEVHGFSVFMDILKRKLEQFLPDLVTEIEASRSMEDLERIAEARGYKLTKCKAKLGT